MKYVHLHFPGLLLACAVVLAFPVASHGKSAAKATLEVEPTQVHLRLGEGVQLRTRLKGRDGTIHWMVEGSGNGTVSSDGFYQAPSYGQTPSRIRLVATVDGDPPLRSEALIFLDSVTLSINPTHLTLDTGQTFQFRARAEGAGDQRVVWSVDGGSTHGHISQGGLFTAPASFPTPGTITVRATSSADPSKSATANVRLEKIEIKVKPEEATIKHGESHRFQATVKGTANTGVTWSVVGDGNGMVSPTGLYSTPPTMATPALVTLIARSIADPSKTAVARVRVEGVAVSANARGPKQRKSTLRRAFLSAYHIAAPHVVRLILPYDPLDAIVPGPSFRGRSGKQYVPLGGAVDLDAVVQNSTNDSVHWEIVGNTVGKIDDTGTYVAPAKLTTPQMVQLRAISQADPTKTVLYTLHIPPVVVDVPKQPIVCSIGGAAQLKAHVENAENDELTWSVEGGEEAGTVSPSGLYHPPASISTPAVVRVKACSTADPSKCAYVVISIPEVRLEVSPGGAELRPGRSVRLKPKLQGVAGPVDVTWQITPNLGTITPDGVYTAPEGAGPQVIQITAILRADPTKIATVTLKLKDR